MAGAEASAMSVAFASTGRSGPEGGDGGAKGACGAAAEGAAAAALAAALAAGDLPDRGLKCGCGDALDNAELKKRALPTLDSYLCI